MKDYILGQCSLIGQAEAIGFGSDEFYIKEIDRDTANKLIIKNHYSHKIYNATYIHLGVFMSHVLVGVLQYGYAMNPASMDGVVAGTKIDEYLELNRMWLEDSAPRNSESMAISYSIKYIKRKYKKIKWIQSFADERCGRFGVVYQAANFQYYGEHDSIFWTLDGEIFHNSLMTRDPKLSKSAAKLQQGKDRATSSTFRQFRYLYFINEKERKNCRLKQEPYPKHGVSA
jgi:adenine modification enzyme